METIDHILGTILFIFGILLSFNVIFTVIGVLFPAKRFKSTEKKYTYAFLLAARDEEKVIGQLIESIKKQDYPQDKITIFVCADRCTDNTAQIARDAGAIVYERNNPPKNKMRRSKGLAIDFLLEHIKKDYPEKGIETFDGYFMFDADNLLAPNYVNEFNKAFDDKRYDFFNSYINAKNCDTNLISAFAGVNFTSANAFLCRPKSLVGVSHFARGRGVLYRSHLLVDGWQWCNITIDLSSSSQMIARGYRSSYCEKAELFEEEPLSLKILFRQRMRWFRGGTNTFCRWGPALLLGIFWPRDWRKKKPESYQKPKFSLLAEVQKRISCYTALVTRFPLSVLTFVYTFLYPVGAFIYGMFISTEYDFSAMYNLVLLYFATIFVATLVPNIITIIREHKRMRANPYKLLAYVFLFPFLEVMIQYVNLWSLIIPVKWKPIPHVDGKTIDEMTKEKTIAEVLYEKKSADIKSAENEDINTNKNATNIESM